jgi:predicted anti-sigma-YlaC factor YlaD
MNCDESRRLGASYLGLELDATDEAELRDHLRECAECRGAYATMEPTQALALGLRRIGAPSSEFTAEVLAGIHQRRFERQLGPRRVRFVLAAAAAILIAISGTLVVHQSSTPVAQVTARHETSAGSPAEPAFIEVDGDDVRVYEMAGAQTGTVQVAFIVDPHMEL